MEGLKEALQYTAELARQNEKTEIVEICGKTYANRSLTRYDSAEKARAVEASTLSAMVDYIENLSDEFPEGRKMMIHIVNPKEVRLMSSLDEERSRETLFISQAETSEYQFGKWYDQENFMIALQANFQPNDDLAAVMRMAGNIDKKNGQTYSDDGVSQVATITVGVASKADALVPNPVELVPYRTFQEVAQPSSNFVFRVRDNGAPEFCLIEAGNYLWRNEAIENVKEYLKDGLKAMPEELMKKITIIG